jgi:hypothetical protein
MWVHRRFTRVQAGKDGYSGLPRALVALAKALRWAYGMCDL